MSNRLHRLRTKLARPSATFTAKYGSNPFHLLLLLAAAAVAGYGVWHWLNAPTPIRLLVWFAVAIIVHDLVAFPIYTAVDRLLIRLIAGADPGPVLSRFRRAAINHVRAPVFISLLLLIMWYPIILKRSDRPYFAASGQHQDRGLTNWLLVVAILSAASLISFLTRLAFAARRPPRPTTTSSQAAQQDQGASEQ